MAIKLVMTSQSILDKVFPGVPRGYDPFAVDEFLDNVLKDYQLIEANVLASKEEIDSLNATIASLKEEKQKLEIELGKYQQRFKDIKEGDSVNQDNLDLLRKIHRYEKFLYSKGYNPKEVLISFDLDNC